MIVVSIAALEANKKPWEERKKVLAEWNGIELPNENLPTPWPPEMNKPYPDIPLIDASGNEFNLSKYSGKIIVVEYVDMTSPVSQSYSGAKKYGVYGKPSNSYDESVMSFESLVAKETMGKVHIPNHDIIYLKIIIYNDNGEQAKPEDAKLWADHFKFKPENNYIIAVPQKDIRDKRTDKIVPGIQLVDSDFLLRVDSAGPNPKHDLRFRLVPLIPVLLEAVQ